MNKNRKSCQSSYFRSGTELAPVYRTNALRSWWRENEIRVFILLAATAAVLGAAGFYFVLRDAHKLQPQSVLEILLLTAQLFVLESNLETGSRVPLILAIARLLAPLTFGYAAFKTFAALLHRFFRLPLYRDHVVICGLGVRGLELARGYRALGRKVVAVEVDAENDLIATCRELGVPVVIGDAAEEMVLRKVNITKAALVYAISGDDGSNIEIGEKVNGLIGCRKKTTGRRVNCYLAVNNLLLSDISTSSGFFRNSSKNSTTRIVRVNDLAARMLFREFPLDRKPIAPDDPTIIHCIVAGFGAMGESVILQAVKLGHFANMKKMKVTVVDRDAVQKGGLLLQVLPALASCSAISFKDMDFNTREFSDFVAEQMALPDTLPYVVFCMNDPMASVNCALRLRSLTGECDVPLYIRLDDNSGLGVLLQRSEEAGEELLNIHGFGRIDKTCTPAIFECWELDHTARAIHEDYRQRRIFEGGDPQSPSLCSWEELDSSLRDSNRQQADHLPVKLRACGYDTVDTDECGKDDRVTVFTPEQIELLARMEHRRWNAERFLFGWKKGNEKNVEKRISPYLVDWEELPDEIKEYDIQTVQNIPAILERERMCICRMHEDASMG
ncbi:MAG: NAD-binding protein [Chitinispirillaceae bacterium]|nr:NAD-binding protein [Chitinispirillaceae bacterium]